MTTGILNQLIVTTDLVNANVGINNTPALDGSVANSVLVGNGQNVGIGNNAPLAGVHLGTDGAVIPAVYLADSTGATLPTVASGAGMFSSLAGAPMFTNASGSASLLTAATIGTGTLVAGTATIIAAGITTSSIILVTRGTTSGDVTTVGTLNVVAGTGSFTVNSTVATDVGHFHYFVV